MARLLEIEYEKIFKPETMAALKGKSGESLRQMLGDKDLQQAIMRSSGLVPELVEAENGYRDQLEFLAADIVTQAYPIIDYADIKIDAKIVSMGDLKIPEEPDEEDPASPDFGEDDPEKDENAIAMLLAMIAQKQNMPGGSSEMVYDDEEEQFVIKARAICFPMLVHEIVKGLYEIVGTEGFGSDKEKNQAIVGAVDKLSNEPRDFQYGKFIYDAISDIYNSSNINDPRVRELLFTEIYKLPEDEFIEFIENAINNELTNDQKKWASDSMRDIVVDLRKDDTGLSDLD